MKYHVITKTPMRDPDFDKEMESLDPEDAYHEQTAWRCSCGCVVFHVWHPGTYQTAIRCAECGNAATVHTG